MNFFRWLFSLFTPKPAAQVIVENSATVADRLNRCADRFAHANDREAELDARDAARQARQAPTLQAALAIEKEFYRSRGLRPDGRPFKPLVGTDSGTPYVRYSNTVRRGGTLGWRYNNPGYVRCSDRATTWGAVGCDGEYAIFPDSHTGLSAMREWLREDYPNKTIGEALRESLVVTQAEEAMACLREAGIDPGTIDWPQNWAGGGGGWDTLTTGEVIPIDPHTPHTASIPQPWEQETVPVEDAPTDNS